MSYTSWLRAAIIRAIRTGAQAALGIIGASVLFADVAWDLVVSGTGMAMLASLLMSLTGLPESNEDAPLEGLGGDKGAFEPGYIIVAIVFFVLGVLCAKAGVFVGN